MFLFSNLCFAEGEEHTVLLYHEAWWLSRGTALSHLFVSFYWSKRTELAALFSDNVWVTTFAYLTDIFTELNKLNRSTQSRNTLVIQLHDRMEGSLRKIIRLSLHVREGNIISMFPSVDEQGDSAILVHLEALEGQFRNYFPEAGSRHRDKAWIQFLFRDNAADSTRLTVTEENLLDKVSSDSQLRIIYETKPLTLFSISCQKDFPLLSAKAMKSFLCFAKVNFPHSPIWKTNTGQDCSLRLIGHTCLTTTFHPRIKSFVCYASGSDISLKSEWACLCLFRIHCPPTCINIKCLNNCFHYSNSTVLHARQRVCLWTAISTFMFKIEISIWATCMHDYHAIDSQCWYWHWLRWYVYKW